MRKWPKKINEFLMRLDPEFHDYFYENIESVTATYHAQMQGPQQFLRSHYEVWSYLNE